MAQKHKNRAKRLEQQVHALADGLLKYAAFNAELAHHLKEMVDAYNKECAINWQKQEEINALKAQLPQ